MSDDRELVIDLAASDNKEDADRVSLFMDGYTGTWRLFSGKIDNPNGECDFSLNGLRAFRDALTTVLEDIEREPEKFNAETRRASWVEEVW